MSHRNTHLAHAEHAKSEGKLPEHSGKAITLLKIDAYEHLGIAVSSSGIDVDGRLDPIFSADRDNASPPLAWSGVAEAATYALVVEDPDAPREFPFVHWMIWNIPGRLTSLPAHVPVGDAEGELAGAVQGKNDMGEYGWYGMKPPAGHGQHRYHFQLFALNRALDIRRDTPLAELVNDLKGATLAKGEAIGTFETPEAI